MFTQPMRAQVCRCQTGDVLGAYKLMEVLGEGGMGTVFKAEHRLLGRRVAIKVLLPEFATRLDVVHRFFKEAQAVNQIDHPNIVDITDFLEGGVHPPYLVMELLEGQNLSKYIQDNAPVRPSTAVAILHQTCDALAAVHELGIVHRDLKPDNIHLVEQPDGFLKMKLLDFGIAKFMATEEAFLKTRTGQLVGTPEYMSPEQIRGLEVDHRIDIYAVGVIFYEMLTGRQPFAGSLTDVLSKHLSEPPQPPSSAVNDDRSSITPALDETVLLCLAKNPDERIQSMGQLCQLLERLPLEDRTTRVTSLIDLPVPRRRRWLWAAGAACLLCLTGVIVLVLALSKYRAGRSAPQKDAGSRRARTTARSMPGARAAPSSKVLELASTPSGASVYRVGDGKFIGQTPVKLRLSTGERAMFVVRLEGHSDSRVTLDSAAKGPVVVVLASRPAARTSASRPGKAHRAGKPRPRRVRPRRDYRGTVNPFKRGGR